MKAILQTAALLEISKCWTGPSRAAGQAEW